MEDANADFPPGGAGLCMPGPARQSPEPKAQKMRGFQQTRPAPVNILHPPCVEIAETSRKKAGSSIMPQFELQGLPGSHRLE